MSDVATLHSERLEDGTDRVWIDSLPEVMAISGCILASAAPQLLEVTVRIRVHNAEAVYRSRGGTGFLESDVADFELVEVIRFEEPPEGMFS